MTREAFGVIKTSFNLVRCSKRQEQLQFDGCDGKLNLPRGDLASEPGQMSAVDT